MKAAGELLGDLTKALIPELDQDLEDFRQRASKAMPTWDDKVLAIERDAHGRPGIKRYNVSDVEDELLAFAGMAEERIRRLERGEKPPKNLRRRAQPPPKSFQPRKK